MSWARGIDSKIKRGQHGHPRNDTTRGDGRLKASRSVCLQLTKQL